MAILLFFAPIDFCVSTTTTPDDHIQEDMIEEFWLSEDAEYEDLPNVWDVDVDTYCVWRPTLQEAMDVAMQRHEQNIRARYEDAQDWDVDAQGMSWEEYSEPFMREAQELLDRITEIADQTFN
jgi:hypothetical protein